MAIKTIKLTFDGQEFGTGIASFALELENGFAKLQALGTDGLPEHMMEDIGEYLLRSIRNNTLDGVDASGNAFQPYAERYKKYPDTPNLYDTGSALNNMYSEPDGNTLYINANDYMVFHQEGSGRVPQRKFIPEDSDLENGAHQEVNAYIERIIDTYIENALDLG